MPGILPSFRTTKDSFWLGAKTCAASVFRNFVFALHGSNPIGNSCCVLGHVWICFFEAEKRCSSCTMDTIVYCIWFAYPARTTMSCEPRYGCDVGHFAAMGGDVATCRWCLGCIGFHESSLSFDVLYFKVCSCNM